MKKSCGNCPQHCPFLRDERTWPGHVARSVDDPKLTSLAFSNDCKPNDLPLILVSLIRVVQSARIGQGAAKSAKTCKCHR
jgi:hypothetical protein